MRFHGVLILSATLCVVACGGSHNPLAPSESSGHLPTPDPSEPSAPRNSIQRVEEGGGGGGGQCLATPSTTCGVLSLTAGDVSFINNDVGVAPTSDPLDFTVIGDLRASGGTNGRSDQPSPGGHFTTAHIRMTVSDGIALVELTLEGLAANASFVTSGTGTAIQATSPSCVPGGTAIVSTQVTVQLKDLGRTQIFERHAANCGA